MKSLFEDVVGRLRDTPPALVRLQALRELPPAAYSDEQWATVEALLDMLVIAAAHLRVLFDGRGCVDFIEVAQAALMALGEPETPTDLGLALDHQVKHLLVDEFQDTSVTQYELLERLIAGWTGDDGRSLLLVGDPMQSIYRFRQAEVHLFTGTARRGYLGCVPLEVVRLSANFRSQARLVDWLNSGFPAILTGADYPAQGFCAVTAERPATPGAAVSLHVTESGAAATEADVVAAIVERTRAEEPLRSIAILVRSRAHLGDVSAALTRRGLRVAASEIDPLGQQPVVNDLIALTRALLHPADRTAWLAVLRAPWCGLDLRVLARVAQTQESGTLWQALQNPDCVTSLSAGDRQRLEHCRGVMARALDLSGRVRMSQLVRFTWRELGGDACLDSTAEVLHAERFFDLLVKLDDDAMQLSPRKLQQHVDKLYAAPSPAGAGAVNIMTIHRAKGLEFDSVILPGLARTTRGEPHRLLMWRERVADGARSELLVAPITKTGAADDPIYRYLRGAEQRELDAEAVRLLYVALTRAKHAVHLVAVLKRDAHGRPVEPAARTFLSLLWPVVADQAARSAAATTVAESPAAPPAPTRAVLRRRAVVPPSAPPRARRRLEEPAQREAVPYEWAGATARHIGTVIHALLQAMARDGIAAWSRARIAAAAPRIGGRLRGFGVPAVEIDGAVARVSEALGRVLESERGRWIMSADHLDAHSEYRLTGDAHGATINVILDRTFIDERGCRWIVDFKTGLHAGGSLEAFLAAETERYRPQLQTYAWLMSLREERPTALGLYFPLLDEWREWCYDGSASAGPASSGGPRR